jgi:hypothetical protein
MAMIPLKPLEPETTLCTLPPGEDAGLIFEIPIEPPGDGADGLSAYQVAVANGFVGNEAAWLAALVGPAGSAGADGADGASVTVLEVDDESEIPETPDPQTLYVIRDTTGAGLIPSTREVLTWSRWEAAHNQSVVDTWGNTHTLTQVNTLFTGVGVNPASDFTMRKRLELRNNNVGSLNYFGWYIMNFPAWTIGGNFAEVGGFHFDASWGILDGADTPAHRHFFGMSAQANTHSDADPSTTLVNCFGVGWDDDDTNMQFLHNDGAGSCTKVNLGSDFPVPALDAVDTYRLQMYSPKGTAPSLHYRLTNRRTLVTVEGSVTTNMPDTNTPTGPWMLFASGGASTQLGVALGHILIGTEY